MNQPLNILCVIPVRGGSKGVPGKNLRPVAGRPLVTWSITHAIGSTTPMRVIVSTDSEDIATVARAAGAEVPFLRPAELATDTAATEPTILHAIKWVRDEGWEPDLVILLQATSPIRRTDSIDRAIDQLLAEDADSLVGVVPSRGRRASGPCSLSGSHAPRCSCGWRSAWLPRWCC
jgi:N-acylneuraminate cytidylyltransferase